MRESDSVGASYLLHVVATFEDDGWEEHEEEKLLVELYQLCELFEASNVLDEHANEESQYDGACRFREEFAVHLRHRVADDESHNQDSHKH